MSQSDDNLVRQAQAGDRAAFEELVRRTSRLVYAKIVLDVGDPHRAEDLVQETWIAALRGLKSVEDATRFRPWLMSIARNVVLDSAKHASRLKRAAQQANSDGLDTHPSSDSPVHNVEVAEQRQRVLAALRELPEEYQAPLSLRYLAGADHVEIEKQLGISNGSLRGLLHRGLKLLRERFGERGA